MVCLRQGCPTGGLQWVNFQPPGSYPAAALPHCFGCSSCQGLQTSPTYLWLPFPIPIPEDDVCYGAVHTTVPEESMAQGIHEVGKSVVRELQVRLGCPPTQCSGEECPYGMQPRRGGCDLNATTCRACGLHWCSCSSCGSQPNRSWDSPVMKMNMLQENPCKVCMWSGCKFCF